jgi:murein DD-endopeptidase MepM/ murein hydrolase activator NlpD
MYYLNVSYRIIRLLFIGLMIILGIIIIKYKPSYEVTVNGESIGYITNKNELQNAIMKYKSNTNEQIAYIDINEMPQYSFKLVSRGVELQDGQVFKKIKETAKITYRMFAINVEGRDETYVSTIEEAYSTVAEIKAEIEGKLNLDISVREVFVENKAEVKYVSAQVAKLSIDAKIAEDLKSSANGIVLSKPVTGNVTSRFGLRSMGYHSGLDIAAPVGTPIYAASSGTVTFCGWYYGYGNLIKISHGNGVETYYGHCNKIIAVSGQEVKTGDLIGEVGSTGNSTGPHLHLEVRVNGIVKNPQNYLYK